MNSIPTTCHRCHAVVAHITRDEDLTSDFPCTCGSVVSVTVDASLRQVYWTTHGAEAGATR